MSPTSVYLDQNVFGHMSAAGDWRQHPIAKELLSAQAAGKVQVWVSPVHVIELAQAGDLVLRQTLANIMLELCEARRMAPTTQVVLIDSFGAFVNDLVPGAYKGQTYVDAYSRISQTIYLGYLALLACGHNIQLGPGVAEVRRGKLESQLIHARIFADPDTAFAAILKGVATHATTTNLDPLGLSALSDVQIESEISALSAALVVPTKVTISKLQKDRKVVASAYGSVDIGAALNSVFGQFPLDLELTFDTPAIISQWPTLQSKYSLPPLAPTITQAPPATQLANQAIVVTVLQLLVNLASSVGLSVATAGYYALIRELEVCMNQQKLPTPGATLDVDHATLAVLSDIFVCHDVILLNNLKSFVNGIKKDVDVVADERQLRKAIARRTGG